MKIQILRTPDLGDTVLPVGAVINLPPLQARALITTGEAIEAPLSSVTHSVSGARILLNAAPNLTLNDTSGGAGTAATPFGISCTIPGGVMGAASAIRVYSAIDWTGSNSKSTIMRIGQASGSWSTATAVSGQSGLSNHRYTPLAAIIGNDGVLTQQRSTSANAVNWFNSSTAAVAVVTNIDTALDWNIYLGVQFGVLNGGDTATLRRVIVELLP